MIALKKPKHPVLNDYVSITFGSLLLAIAMYFFRFPNNFSFGGVSGLAVELAYFFPAIPKSIFMTVMDVVLILIGAIVLGKSFGIRTAYAVIATDLFINLGQLLVPLTAPLTDQPLLELVFSVCCHAAAASIFFDRGASSGGTDIIAMILKKYTSMNIGTALLIVDAIIAAATFIVFDIKTGLFSICGLVVKSIFIDGMIATINRCKVFTIFCKDPSMICDYIVKELHRSATVQRGIGAYTNEETCVVIAIVRQRQAHKLMAFIEQNVPDAFIAISNSSEIIGKGFTEEL